MGMSKQVTFSLACAVVLSALIPGVTGYLSARIESLEAAERKLHAQEIRLNARMAREMRETRPISYPAPCEVTPAKPVREQPPPAAFVPAPEYTPSKKRQRPPVVPPPAWLPN